jgi:hypothetical protein
MLPHVVKQDTRLAKKLANLRSIWALGKIFGKSTWREKDKKAD